MMVGWSLSSKLMPSSEVSNSCILQFTKEIQLFCLGIPDVLDVGWYFLIVGVEPSIPELCPSIALIFQKLNSDEHQCKNTVGAAWLNTVCWSMLHPISQVKETMITRAKRFGHNTELEN